MIDFRYHLVSLISVFLALAVGIILGAGPLQNSIGDTLKGQVSQLRTERNDLRQQLDASNETTKEQDAYISAAGPQLVAGTLSGQKVAIVDLTSGSSTSSKKVASEIAKAGGTVVVQATLDSSWTDKGDESARDVVARGLQAQLGDMPSDAKTPDKLGRALAIALTGADSSGQRSATAKDLEQSLERFGLVHLEAAQTEPADDVVMISATTKTSSTAKSPSPSEPSSDEVSIDKSLAVQVNDAAKAAVVAGPTANSGDLISAIRGDKNVAQKLSTVSGLDRETAIINVPLSLAASLSGETGQYGNEGSATAVIPPAVTHVSSSTPSPSPSKS